MALVKIPNTDIDAQSAIETGDIQALVLNPQEMWELEWSLLDDTHPGPWNAWRSHSNLAWAVSTNETWIFHIGLGISCAAAFGFDWQLIGPVGASARIDEYYDDGSTSINHLGFGALPMGSTTGAATQAEMWSIDGIITTGVNAGNIVFQYHKQANVAGQLDVLAGSHFWACLVDYA